jgi:hypothetical protein
MEDFCVGYLRVGSIFKRNYELSDFLGLVGRRMNIFRKSLKESVLSKIEAGIQDDVSDPSNIECKV